MSATRLGTTHLHGMGRSPGRRPGSPRARAPGRRLWSPVGDDAPLLTEGDGSSYLDSAGDEKRRLITEEPGGGGAASVFLGARTVLLTGSDESWMLEPDDDGMSGGAAPEGDVAVWLT